MSEKDSKREEKFQLGLALFEAGEDAIFETIRAKNELWLGAIQNLQNGKIGVETTRLLKKEVQDMIDVIEIARNLQKLHGKDIESEIKEARLRISFGKLNE